MDVKSELTETHANFWKIQQNHINTALLTGQVLECGLIRTFELYDHSQGPETQKAFLTNQRTAQRTSSRQRILCAIKFFKITDINCPTAIGCIKFWPFTRCFRNLAQYSISGSRLLITKFTRRMLNRLASLAIQQAFSKPCMVTWSKKISFKIP